MTVIGVVKEVKPDERRVGMIPSSVKAAIDRGHQVLIQKGAGLESGYSDRMYSDAGARIVDTPEEIFEKADLMVGVKEPQPEQRTLFRQGQILFTYLHLAPDPDQTRDLINSGVTAIAYETVTRDGRGLPLLEPMSIIAGNMSVQEGENHLALPKGGSGKMLAPVGNSRGNITIIGGGVSGTTALEQSLGLGALVTMIEKSEVRLKELQEKYKAEIADKRLTILASTPENILETAKTTDLMIYTVLVPGDKPPKLITQEVLDAMPPRSVVVDVSIDQGGGVVGVDKNTTHAEPIIKMPRSDGSYIKVYAVGNMPGAFAPTASFALNEKTLPFILALADKGVQALLDDPHLGNGANIVAGHVTYKAVADAQGLPYVDLKTALAGVAGRRPAQAIVAAAAATTAKPDAPKP